MSDNKAAISAYLAEQVITVESVFIPFSQSRSAANKDDLGNKRFSLNWQVVLKRNGRVIVATDYGAGMGHSPNYNKPIPTSWNGRKQEYVYRREAWESENGFEARYVGFGPSSEFAAKERKNPLKPDALNVVYSLISDSDVINAGGFESWAGDFGYDADSIKALATYNACLDIALKLRAGIGQEVMDKLSELFQDF